MKNEEITKICDKAFSLAEKGFNEEAIALCNNLEKEDNGKIPALREKSAIYRYMGEYDKAEENAQKVIDAGAIEPHDFYQLGKIKFSLGDYKSSILFLSEGIDICINSNSTYYLNVLLFFRAISYNRISEYEMALADCKQLPKDFSFFLPNGDEKYVEEILNEAIISIEKNVKKKWTFE